MSARYEVSRGCTGCGTCIAECPEQAISITVTGGARIDPQCCVGCGLCRENCASEAIEAVPVPAEEGRVGRGHATGREELSRW